MSEIGEGTSKLLTEVNAIPVSKEDLWKLVADSEAYHRDNPDAEPSFEAMIASRVKRGDFRKVQAIWCRMNALAKLITRRVAMQHVDS